jgi:hypothetical protein
MDFFIQGKADETLPSSSSVYVYNLANKLKKSSYMGVGHSLSEVLEEVYMKVRSWIIDNLK